MRPRKRLSGIRNISVFAMIALAFAGVAWAGAKKEVLYSFKGGKDGKYPTYPGLIFDKAGNLYGTTFDGGIGPLGGFGTVFELTPKADGSWTETVLHRFTGGRDGAFPYSGLVFDAAGNLYGTTDFGGGLGSCLDGGVNYYCGTVYRLSPGQNGKWTETILRRFDAKASGGYLQNNLILDAAGNLYGVAEGGDGCAQYSCGVVFELISGPKVPWKEKILYSFHGSDGDDAQSPLMFDAQGNLYGTTIGGGAADAGVVFRLEPTKKGPWKQTVLHTFTPLSHDGGRPCGRLVFDKQGNLYGSTQNGGKYPCQGLGCGIVYELAHDTWDEAIIHYFNGHRQRNFQGIANDTQGVAFDASGNLYGTATGTTLFPGGIFQLIRQQDGTWKERLVSKFPVGVSPGMAIYGTDGNLYGGSFSGGDHSFGAVFRITP